MVLSLHIDHFTLLDKVFPHVDRKAVYARNKDVQTDDFIFWWLTMDFVSLWTFRRENP